LNDHTFPQETGGEMYSTSEPQQSYGIWDAKELRGLEQWNGVLQPVAQWNSRDCAGRTDLVEGNADET
jgi:hypothetical protein